MILEDILKTAKEDLWDRPDEWVRSQYQNVGDKIPRQAFYPCTTLLMCLGISEISWMAYFPDSIYLIPMLAGYLHFQVLIKKDAIYNMDGLFGFVPPPFDLSAQYVLDKRVTSANEYNRHLRFPLFVAGAFFSAVVAYHFKEYFVDDISFVHSIRDAIIPFGFFSTASSMYLKDRDPKQFKKDPFWKRAYDAITEGVGSYLPQPVPTPIPVQKYAVAESASLM